jgi:HK97 family phage portal protein
MSLFNLFKKNEIVEKSFGENSLQQLINIIQGKTDKKNYTDKDLLDFNTSWVYSCNSKNAITTASVPLHLYYVSNGKEIKYTKHKKISTKSLERIKGEICNIEIKNAEEIVEIQEHPLLTLFQKINKDMDYSSFTYLLMSYMGLLGNSYVYVEREGNSIKALHPLRTENVEVKINNDGEIVGIVYKEQIGNETKVTRYQVEDLIVFRNLIPGCGTYGKGELAACLDAVERYNYYAKYEAYLNRNFARPDFIASYKGNVKEDQLRDARKAWSRKFGNPENAGKPLVTGELDVKTLSFSPRDMEFKDGREWCKKEIAAVFGVPESLITLNDANLASARSALNHYYSFTIIPKLRMLCETYNSKLVMPYYGDDLFLWYSDKDFLKPQDMTYSDLMNAHTKGILDKNEVRLALGYDSIDEDVDISEINAPEDKDEQAEI